MQNISAFILASRPHQWTKNLLVFAALIFSGNLNRVDLIAEAALAFAAFCLLSSGVYLINDILDYEKDRAHPVKRFRPIASGRLGKKAAFGGALLLFCGSALAALPAARGWGFPGVLAGYFLLNLGYSFFLKKMVVADVIAIALGFLLRVAAGGLAIGVELSHWLILCTFFAALMIASCKRRAELVVSGASLEARAVLEDYSPTLLDLYIAISAAAAVMAYALYTVSERTIEHLHTSNLILTVPVVMYGIGRYLYLVYRRSAGEDPAEVMAKDRGMIAVVVLWIGLTLLILYGLS